MQNNILGIIFSDIHENNADELTSNRTIASLPFAGKYRLVDFSLSNMVNSEVSNIGIVTKSNYASLMEHIGSGNEWDLSGKNRGVIIFPPFSVSKEDGLKSGRLNALKRVLGYIKRSSAEYVILADSDVIFNINYKKVIEFHKENNADITAVFKKMQIENKNRVIYKIDEENRVCDVCLRALNQGEKCVGLNTWIMKKDFLEFIISDAIAHDYQKFCRDILVSKVNVLKIKGYEYDGYVAFIEDAKSYYKYNMDMLKKENLQSLFYVKDRTIYTKIKDSAPTKYEKNAEVKGSLIADGCVISGTVENSILFRGVKVLEGAVVKDCVLMRNTIIRPGAKIQSVITDSNVLIKEEREILSHENYPLYIKNDVVI